VADLKIPSWECYCGNPRTIDVEEKKKRRSRIGDDENSSCVEEFVDFVAGFIEKACQKKTQASGR